MRSHLLAIAMNFKTPIAASTIHKPSPPVPPQNILSSIFGSYLASVFIVLMILALLGVACSIAWMFITRRWLIRVSLEKRILVITQSSLQGEQLKDKNWLYLATECVELFDELEHFFPDSNQRSEDPRQEVANHVKLRLQEILKRSGVEMISSDHVFDENRHQLEQFDPEVGAGTPITKTVSPGFAVGRRVLRLARVRVTSTLQDNIQDG